jgi:hypothetical protein
VIPLPVLVFQVGIFFFRQQAFPPGVPNILQDQMPPFKGIDPPYLLVVFTCKAKKDEEEDGEEQRPGWNQRFVFLGGCISTILETFFIVV